MTTYQFQNRALVVADEAMERTIHLAVRAAKSSASVLVVGESGTGKELVARFIHEKSTRAGAPFVSVNCAAIPEGLMEAELFGYERGAFTGAVQRRIGKFEQATRGTLLLDEVSEMPVTLQAKLLRVLQEGEIDRLGGSAAVPIDTRIIATTNRDPLKLIASGSFREDLYFRLNVFRIECVPLRDRPGAVAALAEAFLRQAAIRHGESGYRLSPAALARLEAYRWPGNIRELQNAIERACLLSDSGTVEPKDFDLSSAPMAAGGISLADVERGHILGVLGNLSGNRTEAAKVLGISTRTLRNKLKEYSA